MAPLPRWLRRRPWTAAFVALVLLTLVVRLVWGWHLSRQVAKRVAEIRAAGHPTTLAEVVIEQVPDAENAWPVFVRAIGALNPGVDSPRNSVLEYPWYPPYGQEWEDLAAASEAAHGRTFALARKARGARRAQPRATVSDPANIFRDVPYNKGRTLANVLADGAAFAHLCGDHAEAVERVRDLLHLGRSLRADPCLISHLVGIGYEALATNAALTIAPTLAVDGAAAEAGGRPASRQQVRELIAELLDERESHAALARTYAAERAQIHDVIDRAAAETWVIRPMADHVKLRWFDAIDTLIEAARQPNFAAANRVIALEHEWDATPTNVLPGAGGRNTEIPRYSRWFDSSGGPASIASALQQHYRLSAERRVTAVSLAARLYRLDHDGRWPEALADLVPDYLPAVPADPFYEDGRPLGYVIQRGALPDGTDRPLVYFDAEGSDGAIGTEPTFGWQSEPRVNGKRPTRQHRDLALWFPKARRFDEERRLQAEAVDDDPEEADAAGDDEQDDAQGDEPPGE